MKTVISFFAVDEAHLIEEWGSTFRPAYKDLTFIRSCLPSVPIMALSATAPRRLISAITYDLGMSQHVLISGPLNRPNLFFSLDSTSSIPSVFHSLSSVLSSISSIESIPKTLIFCRSKDTLYNVYAYLVSKCNSSARGTVGQYHATMTTDGRTEHYQQFKSGKERVLVATSAFGLGVDISDISEVILFGVPDKGSELVQLAGRGGRDPMRMCLVRFVVRAQDLKECDSEVVKLASGKFCLREVILRDLLWSDESLPASDLCCSFCCSSQRPRVFQPELPCTLLPTPTACQTGSVRSRRVLAAQRAALKFALLELRQTAGGTRFRMRGLDGVLSKSMIENIVKQCNKICCEADVVALGVVKEFSVRVFELVDFHVPRTVFQTSECSVGSICTRSTSHVQGDCRVALADRTNH